MRTIVHSSHGELFRPFFWVDEELRIRDWPEATARALRLPAKAALGRFCWDLMAERRGGHASGRCTDCPMAMSRFASLRSAGVPPARHALSCAVLSLPGATGGALVWFPLSHVTPGGYGSVRLEGLVIRGALAERLDSIENMLEGLRQVCAADDCELFLLDAFGKEVFLVDCEGHDRDAFTELTRMPLGMGYPGTVTLLQKPLYTNRFQKDRLFLRGAVKRRGIHSFIGVPLLEGGRPLGYVGVGWRDGSVPLEWGVRVLQEVKSIIPLAVPRRYRPLRSAEVPPVRLAIRCFGAFEIHKQGCMLAPAAFTRRRALQLLKHLLLRHGVPVHRDRLIDMFWPDASPRAGANRLHGVVNALRSAIEAGRGPRASAYILCRDDHYSFNIEAPHAVDLFDFVDSITGARKALREGVMDRALGLLEAAVQLYRGDLFADDVEDDALETHRVRLRHMYLDAVRSLADMQIQRGRADEAIRVLRAALEVEPAALDLHEILIGQLAEAGRLAEARHQYECCRMVLLRLLDMEAPPRIRALEKLLH